MGQLDHADTWLLFTENMGPHLAIDETSLSNGELYTFVTNRDRHAGEGSLVAVVSGTKSEDVIRVLKQVDEEERMKVEEVTLDLSDSMRRIVAIAFPKAQRVIDRFHIQKMACEAVQEIRVAHRWDALQQANDEMEECRLSGKPYHPFRFPNGDTRPELLIRKPLSPVQVGRQVDGKAKGKGENPVRGVSRHPTRLRAVAFTEDDILQEHD